MAAFLSLVKTWWPIVSMVVSLLSGMHAAHSHAKAADGSVSISSQATNVAGAGLLSGVALVAGAAGVISNHKSAASAPSVAPAGVDPVLHQESVLHAALIVDSKTTKGELDKLNELIQLRKKDQ